MKLLARSSTFNIIIIEFIMIIIIAATSIFTVNKHKSLKKGTSFVVAFSVPARFVL